MPTFGEKLRSERERRNTPLSDVARRTRIGIRYLEALERDEFEELPGPRGFGKLYIRAYAELLGFDPAPLIQEYDEVVHRRLREAGDDEGEPARPRVRRVRYVPPPRRGPVGDEDDEPLDEEPELPGLDDDKPAVELFAEPPDTGPPEREPARRIWIAGAAIGALLVLVTMAVLLRGEAEPAPPVEAVEQVAAPSAPVAAVPDVTIETPVEVKTESEPEPEPEPTQPPAATTPTRGPALRVTSAGVGTGVSNLRLVGEAARFDEGDVVSFLTRVRGGVVGQPIRHVWIHEGRTIQSIPLTLGGANWRTYSNKTVRGAGEWAVEARDARGEVLARREFEVRRVRR